MQQSQETYRTVGETTALSRGEPAMTLDAATIAAIAVAVVERLRPLLLPPGWPEGRGTLSEPETAQFLGIGQDFLRELRVEGKISHTAQGRRITYSARDVSDYLDLCRRHGNRGRSA